MPWTLILPPWHLVSNEERSLKTGVGAEDGSEIKSTCQEDPGSLPSTHIGVHNHLELQFQGTRYPF